MHTHLAQQRGRMRLKVIPLLLFAAFSLFYYFSNQGTVPLTGRKQVVGISPHEELLLGLQSYQTILHQSDTISDGPQLNLIRSIGRRLAAVSEAEGFEWEFNLLNSPEVNAFCLPGGKVAVYSGILPIAQNPDGLAVIMGHEISHAIARHGAERMAHEQLAQIGQLALGAAVSEMDNTQQRAVLGAFGIGAQFGVLLPFSRSHESEADYMGLLFMSRACFNPEEAPRFWERMMRAQSSKGAPPEFLSTHPSDQRRIEQLREWMPQALAEREKYCSKGSGVLDAESEKSHAEKNE